MSAYKVHLRGLNRALILLLCWGLSACTGVPEGVEPVTGFELQRYLGRWYEIARLDHAFERRLSKVSAEYSMREDGGLKVVNRGYNALEKAWATAEGKGYFMGGEDVGQLKVSFFGPFYGSYNIIALDKDNYQYAMVAGPDLSYLWILAREKVIAPTVRDKLVAQAKALGFAVDELIFVEH